MLYLNHSSILSRFTEKANDAACWYLECIKELNDFIHDKYYSGNKSSDWVGYK